METYAGFCSMLPHSLPQTTMFCFSSLYPFILFVLILKRLTLCKYIWSPTKCDAAQMKLIQGTKCGRESTRDKMGGVLFHQIWLDTSLGRSSPMLFVVVVVHLLSCVQLFANQWTAAGLASLSCTISLSLFKLMSIDRWCHPTISSSVVHFASCLQSFPASGSFLMSWLFLIRWPKYWSFSISPSNEYWGLISFRMGWLDLLAVQGTLKSLLQHHNSKASILQCSAFFMVQISHPYKATGKNHSFDYKDLCWKSAIFAFLYVV